MQVSSSTRLQLSRVVAESPMHRDIARQDFMRITDSRYSSQHNRGRTRDRIKNRVICGKPIVGEGAIAAAIRAPHQNRVSTVQGTTRLAAAELLRWIRHMNTLTKVITDAIIIFENNSTAKQVCTT